MASNANYGTGWLSVGTLDATAAAADVALTVSERSLATVKDLDNVVWQRIDAATNGVEVRFKLATNGANVNIDVWAGRLRSDGTENADLIRMCTLDVEAGTQQAHDIAADLLADEIVLTNESWLKDIRVVQSVNDSELCARLYIPDMCGYNVLLFHGHTTFAEDAKVELAGWVNTHDLVPT